jgi:hypothetical protein
VSIQVHYGVTFESFLGTTPLKRLTDDSGCVELRSLPPGTTLYYMYVRRKMKDEHCILFCFVSEWNYKIMFLP